MNINCKLNAAKEYREWQLAFIKQLIYGLISFSRPGLSTGHIPQVKSTGHYSIDKLPNHTNRLGDTFNAIPLSVS